MISHMLAVAGTVASLTTTAAPPMLREYTVDFGHSIVEFSIGFAFTRVKGRFTDAKGTILYDEAQPSRSSVTMVIDSKSIDTGWPHRDEHLRTSDFFDVEKYPTIVFQSTRLVPNGDGWVAHGNLSMHGVTKDVAIAFRLTQPPTRDPESRWMVINAAGSLRLARADFGITGGSTHNAWFNRARMATMGDSVDISLEIEGYSADALSQRSQPVEDVLQRIRTSGVQSQIDRLQEAKKTRPPTQQAGLVSGVHLVVRALLTSGQTQDAVTLGHAGVEMFPAEPRAAAAYALALSVSGDSRGAAREYARMKQVFHAPVRDPNEKFPQDDENWWYLDQMARTTTEWGSRADALALARAIVDLYPGAARSYTTLGNLLALNGDANGAAAAYAHALELDPRETRALEWQRRIQ